MAIKFEKVDDILTEDARDTMTDKLTADIEFIKDGVMALVAITMKPKYNLYANDSTKVFDTIAEISDQLDEMWEVYADLGYAYSTLLEKYQEATKEAE